MNRSLILSSLIIAIIITIIAFFSSFLIPIEVTETTEETDEDGIADASITAEPSPISIIIQALSVFSLILLFFIIIFMIKNEFHLRSLLEFCWMIGTPFLFITLFMNQLFEKRPCPAHHSLELLMIISIFLFIMIYLIMLLIISIETLIILAKNIQIKWRNN